MSPDCGSSWVVYLAVWNSETQGPCLTASIPRCPHTLQPQTAPDSLTAGLTRGRKAKRGHLRQTSRLAGGGLTLSLSLPAWTQGVLCNISTLPLPPPANNPSKLSIQTALLAPSSFILTELLRYTPHSQRTGIQRLSGQWCPPLISNSPQLSNRETGNGCGWK